MVGTQYDLQWLSHQYTTFTDRATRDWAEIWGDRTSSLYTNTYGKGWLLVNIVGYFIFQSSFSLFYGYYLLICHQSALERTSERREVWI